MIAVPPVDNDEREAPQFVSRANLVRIIKPRIEEILEMVRDRLASSPFASEPRGRVVLTGGASQLTGLAGLADADSRPSGAHRPPARHLRPARAGQGTGFCRRYGASDLPAVGASRAFRTAAQRGTRRQGQAAISHGSDDGFARASDELDQDDTHRPVADRPDPGGNFRVMKRQT